MGDEQHRGLVALPEAEQQVAHLGPGHLVEGGEGLVHQQDGGPEGEGPHQGDALLHAARQLPGVGVEEVAQAHLGEQRPGLVVADAGGRAPARRFTLVSSRAFWRTVRQGSRAGVWGTKPNPFARRATAGDWPATRDRPAIGREQAAHEPQQRRLAAAARADEADELAPAHLEIDAGHRPDRRPPPGERLGHTSRGAPAGGCGLRGARHPARRYRNGFPLLS